MTLRIDNVKWTTATNGLPLLKLNIDGVTVVVDPAQKFLDRGIVVLSLPPGKADMLPPVTIPADKADGRGPLTLREATKDKVVLRLVREFVEAVVKGTFTEKEVKLE